MERMLLTGPSYENREGARSIPYTGRALARFERSTLPDHKETRTVVLRFLKIITRVKCMVPNYDGKIVPPKEGEFHQRNFFKNSAAEAWSLNIDQKKLMIQGLR